MDGPLDAGRRHQRRALARRGHGAASKRSTEGDSNAVDARQAGPPDRGRHRHRRRHLARRRQGGQLGEADRRASPASATITRFPTDGLKTTHRRHRRLRPGRAAVCAPALSERLAESRRRGGDRASPASAARAISRARCSSPCRRSRSNGRSARELAQASGANADDHLRRHRCAPRRPAASRPITSASCSARSPSTSPTSSAPRARRSRSRPPAPPARPRSSSASRRSGAARRDAALCIGTDGSVNPESLIRFSLLSALSTSNDPPRSARPSRSPRTATASSWPRAPARWCWRASSARAARGAEDPRRASRLRRDGRRLPPHPLEPGRQADHRLHPQRARRRRPRRPTTSTTSTRTAPARRRTTRWSASASSAVFGERAKSHPDLVQQVDDRPHAVGRRRGRGGVHAADAASTSACRRPSTTRCPTRRSRSTWCRTWRATPRCGTCCPTRSASAGRTSRLVIGAREPA